MGPTKSPLTICGLVLQRLPTLNEVIEATDDARSAYDWTTFEEDEVVLWEGKPHRYSLIPAFVIGVIFAIILIGLIILAWAWVDWKNTTYVITNRGVYRKRGALSREVKRVSFEKIQNTSLKQGVIGTQFDYGNVEISTAGSEGAEVTFRAVPEPRSIQQRVNTRLERKQSEDPADTSNASATTDDRTVELLEEIRDELRDINRSMNENE